MRASLRPDLRGRTALLNVIPYNPVSGLPYKTPSHKAQDRFLQILRDAGINVQVRERKGDKIDAACGQLRRSGVEVGKSSWRNTLHPFAKRDGIARSIMSPLITFAGFFQRLTFLLCKTCFALAIDLVENLIDLRAKISRVFRRLAYERAVAVH